MSFIVALVQSLTLVVCLWLYYGFS